MTRCESVIGAESAASTEGHTPWIRIRGTSRRSPGAPPWNGDRARTTPSTARRYEFWQNYRADFWPGPQLGWVTQEPETGEPLNRLLFSESGEQDLWTFRRIR